MKLPVAKLKLYLDTTIPSYAFAVDSPERMEITRKFLRLADSGEYEMLISEIVLKEIQAAAEPKRTLLLEQVNLMHVLTPSAETEHLAHAYVQRGILPPSSIDDARHVAIATLHPVDALVSWNFSHLVNIRRTRAINMLHEERGLPHIEIITPQEVLA